MTQFTLRDVNENAFVIYYLNRATDRVSRLRFFFNSSGRWPTSRQSAGITLAVSLPAT